MQLHGIGINNRYEFRFSMYDITLKLTSWIQYKIKFLLSPLRLHSTSIQIPQSTNTYNSMLPSIYVSPLNFIQVPTLIYKEFLVLPALEIT